MGQYIGFIQAVAPIKSYEGNLQMGFRMVEKWFNIKATQGVLAELKETTIKKGYHISFDVVEGFVTNIQLESSPPPAEKSENRMNKKGKWEDDIITFEELLNNVHKKEYGLKSIKTEMLEHNSEKKFAVFKATITIKGGKEFTGHGEATQENCGEMIKKHYLRMAETRAIARACRWTTNNAKTAKEELAAGDKPIEKKEAPTVEGQGKLEDKK